MNNLIYIIISAQGVCLKSFIELFVHLFLFLFLPCMMFISICILQMSKKIEDLEKAALGVKPWQLSGEVTAQARPENSMLEEDVEFDQTSRSGTRLKNLQNAENNLCMPIKNELEMKLDCYVSSTGCHGGNNPAAGRHHQAEN